MKKSILMVICVIATLSCHKEVIFSESDLETDSDILQIEAIYPATKANDTSFESGDCIGLYAVEYEGEQAPRLQIGGNYLNNERMAYDGVQWKGVRPVFWSSKPCDFYAYYPYQQLTSVDSQIFNLVLDQSTPGTQEHLSGYEASDLLWAKVNKVSQADKVVPLQFKHLMSRLMIEIVKGDTFVGEIPEDASVNIYNTITSAMVDLVNGNLEKNIYGTKNIITAKKVDSQTFSAILVPQNIDRRTPLIEVTMGGISYLLKYSMSFHPGRQYLIRVIVNTSPDQEKIEISIDGEVQPWN